MPLSVMSTRKIPPKGGVFVGPLGLSFLAVGRVEVRVEGGFFFFLGFFTPPLFCGFFSSSLFFLLGPL